MRKSFQEIYESVKHLDSVRFNKIPRLSGEVKDEILACLGIGADNQIESFSISLEDKMYNGAARDIYLKILADLCSNQDYMKKLEEEGAIYTEDKTVSSPKDHKRVGNSSYYTYINCNKTLFIIRILQIVLLIDESLLSKSSIEYEIKDAEEASLFDMIEKAIQKYKSNIELYWKNEKYKWIAVENFRKNWNIDAENFSEMIEKSLSKAGNLLTGGMYYPRNMIQEFSNFSEIKTKELFEILFNENTPLSERFQLFKQKAEEFLDFYPKDGKSRNTYQDLRAICVYLSFMYPNKYFMYKASVYNEFKNKVGYKEFSQASNPDVRKYENFSNLCEKIVEAVKEDPELMEVQSKLASSDGCFADLDFHVLAQTIMYVNVGEYAKAEGDALSNEEVSEEMEEKTVKELFDHNIILYGPPGTGKTYNTITYAVAICENRPIEEIEALGREEIRRRYNEYSSTAVGRIAFTTFHQSYGYEEFIEGIRPIMDDENSEEPNEDIKYKVKRGIFREFCENAAKTKVKEVNYDFNLNRNPVIWKVSLEGSGDNETRRYCLENGVIRIGWDDYGPTIDENTEYKYGGQKILNAFIKKMRVGDVVLSCFNQYEIDAIGVITGEYEWNEEYEYYRRSRKVNWLFKNERENIVEINNGSVMTQSTVYRMKCELDDIMSIVRKHMFPNDIEPTKNYVFIIDEINRGNISKIFGELITLVESSKRKGNKEEAKAVLPYSKVEFSVPKNVYILGTMNTADRSIALMDTALRRRFSFIEMMPDPKLLDGLIVSDDKASVDIGEMLRVINKRIEVLYDREHTIGHAFFMDLWDEEPGGKRVEKLSEIFKKSVIPLLQEYFYEDYDKIRMVLGDNAKKSEEDQFIVKKEVDWDSDFIGDQPDDIDITDNYFTIKYENFKSVRCYQGIISKL